MQPDPMQPRMYDDIERHLGEADDFAAAAVPTGMYLAWCANLHLLDTDFQQQHESLLLRLRYREITGAEFFIAACGGRFERSLLNARGQAFTDHYYPHFLDDYREVFGADTYAVKDDWAHYDLLAPVLMRHLMAPPEKDSRSDSSAAGRLRKWWQSWH